MFTLTKLETSLTTLRKFQTSFRQKRASATKKKKRGIVIGNENRKSPLHYLHTTMANAPALADHQTQRSTGMSGTI